MSLSPIRPKPTQAGGGLSDEPSKARSKGPALSTHGQSGQHSSLTGARQESFPVGVRTGGSTNCAVPFAEGTVLRMPYAPLRMDALAATANTLKNVGSFASVVQVSVLFPGEIHVGLGAPTENAGRGI